MIRFDVLTLFPEMMEAVLGHSIIGRARDKGLIELNFVNIRDFSANKHKKTDFYPYSGGGGMVLTPQPVYDAYQSVAANCPKKPLTLYMSPQGEVFNQQMVVDFAKEEHIVLICGHYEGLDQRILDMLVDREVSVGDFVLTGGELPAMTVIDAVSRLIPGVLAGESNYQDESHYSGLLEYPQYTRPEEFMGRRVPSVLLNGNHRDIEKWKREQSLLNTFQKRPDMLKSASLSETDQALLERFKREEETQRYWFYDMPIGRIGIVEAEGMLVRICSGEERFAGVQEQTPLILEAGKQLREYFAGERKKFLLPLHLEGTPFQRLVWNAISRIPYGETQGCKELAEAIGRPGAQRAVEMAAQANAFFIVVPSHRVTGQGGSMNGCGAGGITLKKHLFDIEQEFIDRK